MASNIEEPAYELVRAYSDFECGITPQRASPRSNSRQRSLGGFRRVAGYIFGGNQTGESIAMTAPVSMWEEKGAGWLAFTMPSAYDLEALPTPHDAGVLLVAQPKQRVAVMSFSGRTTPRKTERVEEKLRAAIVREGLRGSGPAVLAVYENPWTTLPFMRRNEIQINLDTSMEEA